MKLRKMKITRVMTSIRLAVVRQNLIIPATKMNKINKILERYYWDNHYLISSLTWFKLRMTYISKVNFQKLVKMLQLRTLLRLHRVMKRRK